MRRRSVAGVVVLCLALVAAGRSAVSIKNMQYSPASISINTGDTVVWTNNDDRDHTVVADDGSFTSDNIKAGTAFERKFAKAGTYKYHCKYHPRMKGTVVVKD